MASILTQQDWANLLTQPTFSATDLDGHFVVLRWRKDRVECFTDQLGLRTVYYGKCEQGICLSTRMDWVTRNCGNAELDFKVLGSRWLLFNQISYESGVLGIGRLGPGGHAVFQNGAVISAASVPWLPSFKTSTTAAALEILTAFIRCALDNKYTPSLGLSGGLDSRLILALLTSFPKAKFVTHTFGDPADPDAKIAGNISSGLELPHANFNDPLPGVPACVSILQSFVTQMILVGPGTLSAKLRYYRQIRAAGRLVIDGGFGEIARRQYMNRVVRLGRSAARSGDSSAILPLMRQRRAAIFSPQVMQLLAHGAAEDLQQMIDAMPAVEKTGVENFADLMAVRTRVPNLGGPEQAWLDAQVLNFMPLVQPSFLQAVFGIPARMRSNAEFYMDAIHKSNPLLTRFPLVKSGFTYPFGLSSNTAWLLVKAKSKFTRGYSDPGPDRLLFHIREYVLDEVHSASVKDNSVYNSGKVIDAVTKYYQGEFHLRDTVDWWLTFEVWRRSLLPQGNSRIAPAKNKSKNIKRSL
jgi:hypothetical protein